MSNIHIQVRHDGGRGFDTSIQMNVFHPTTVKPEFPFEFNVGYTDSKIVVTASERNYAQDGGESRCSEVTHFMNAQQARELAQRLNDIAAAFEGAASV